MQQEIFFALFLLILRILAKSQVARCVHLIQDGSDDDDWHTPINTYNMYNKREIPTVFDTSQRFITQPTLGFKGRTNATNADLGEPKKVCFFVAENKPGWNF